jgi:hypothetical protein
MLTRSHCAGALLSAIVPPAPGIAPAASVFQSELSALPSTL